jgi:hypothetical protein
VASAESIASQRYEPAVLPVIAGDTDVGFKFGGFLQLARFRDDVLPYRWRLQFVAAASVHDGATGTEYPYREIQLRIDRPHAFVPPLRIVVQLIYFRTTNLGFYGVGNSTWAQPLWSGLPEGSDDYVRARHYYQFDGLLPQVRAIARYNLSDHVALMVETDAQWSEVNVYPGSLLEQSLRASPLPLGEGGQGRISAGFVFDSRDHETVPTVGQYHDLSMRCGAGARGGDGYCAANLTLRAYQGILGGRLSIAGRLLGDTILGPAPLGELSRYGGVDSATGPAGSRGIRGVPQGRLAGKSKVVGNLELRTFFLPFSVGSQRFALGSAAFADVGRVWTGAFFSSGVSDGPFRLHWGAGGGPRLRWGDSLVIRADLAYAPLGAQLNMAPGLYVEVEAVM